MCIPFLEVYWWSRKLLFRTICLLFCVDGSARQIHHSLEMAKIEIFLSLRYLSKSVSLPKLWFHIPVAVLFLLGLI